MKTRELTFLAVAAMVLSGMGNAWAVDASNTLYGQGAGINISSGLHNSFFGLNAGLFTTSGSYNTFIGDGAGFSNTQAKYNTFVGYLAGFASNSLLLDSHNTFIGSQAGTSTTSGNKNTFIGDSAGYSNTDGTGNTYLGSFAGSFNAGNNNTIIGYSAGFANTAGNGNVFLGSDAGYSEPGSNRLYIDNCYATDTLGQCTRPLIYGEFDNRIVRIDGRLEMVTVATPSDIRYKKEIHVLNSPLQKVLNLQGVTYEWDKDKVNGAGFEGGRQIGLIAQEVEKVLPELVHTDAKGYKTLSYDKLGPLLIEAVKEQQKTIAKQEAVIAELKDKLEKALGIIEQRLASLENPAKATALK